MSEVSDAELEAIYARIDAACDRETARCGGDEIEAMGSLSVEVHDLIALRARLAAQATELAVLRAQLAPLCAEHDALWAASGITDAGASPDALIAAVRARGAEEMRRRCAEVCMDHDAHSVTVVAALCADEIRALPLPGDDAGGV